MAANGTIIQEKEVNMNDATAAPVPVRLNSGEMVLVSPLTQRGVVSLLKAVKKSKLDEAIAAIPRDLDKELYKELFRDAIQQANNITIDTIDKKLADIDVLETTLRFILRDSKLTEEQMFNILNSQNDTNAVLNAATNQQTECVEDNGLKSGAKKK